MEQEFEPGSILLNPHEGNSIAQKDQDEIARNICGLWL